MLDGDVVTLHHGGVTQLDLLLHEHRNTPFPDSVTKGVGYGEVDPVMIDADICGWASRVAAGSPLGGRERQALTEARGALERSLDSFPTAARPYYETLVEIAAAAL